MFTEGRDYTRDEIHAEIGGSTETYLPHRDGRILCACLDRDLNPDAPDIIIPGTGPMIEKTADMLRRQTGAIPVFIKRETGAWRYVGDFEVEPRRYTPADIEAQKKRSGRTDITRVIWLRPAVPLHPARTHAEVIAAARRFSAEVRGTAALRRIFRTTRVWVPTGEGAWAPATWAAHGDVGIDTYVAAMQAKFKAFTLDEATAIKIMEGLGFVFSADPSASGALASWAGTMEPRVLDGIEPASFKFATATASVDPADVHDPEPDDDDGDVDDGAAGTRAFGLLVNPARYDVVGASAALDEDTWLLPAGEARLGDRLAFWRTTHGADRRRGVVAFAEVIGVADMRIKEGEGLRFWLEEPPADPQRRIRVRYVDAPNLPLWLEDDDTGTLAALSVGRGQGTKLYKITVEQWAALVKLAGGWNPRDVGASTEAGPPPSAPAAPAPLPVRLVVTAAEIAQTITSFNNGAEANAGLVWNILRTTSLWVYDSDSDTFGPNKFVGWHPITFALYEQGRQDQVLGGSKFDGNVTRVAIETAVGRSYASRPAAHAALVQWAEAIGGAGVLDIPTPEKWEFLALDLWPDQVEDQRVAAEITEAAEEIVQRRRGQGYSSDPAVRRAVELHAMAVAKAYLVGLGRDPKDTSATRPYDFECEGAPDHRYVEVKGTTGDGSEVLLTVNEVEHARAHPGVSALFVVHGIKVESAPDGTIIASGGTTRVISPWSPDDGLLRPLTFRYTVP